MNMVLNDLRFAVRQFLKAPGFTVLAVVTLALGIGANTAMFTVVESVLLRRLPYPGSERIVYIGPPSATGLGSTSWLNYRDIREQSRQLEEAAGFSEDVAVVQGEDSSTSVSAPRVTPSTFRLLGVQPLLGRTFNEAEGQSGGPGVVLLSEGLWRNQFHSDPAIIGHSIQVNGQPKTVIGVMPASFRFPEFMGNDLQKGLWLPLQPNQEMLIERGYNFFSIVGRLKPGVTVAREQSELDNITRQIHQMDTKAGKDLSFKAVSYQEMLTGSVRPVLIALLLALGLVLLIACANVSNLILARFLGRQQEFAVRAALGAGQWRLARQLLIEGASLSLLGCLLGFGLAQLAIIAVGKLPPDSIPRSQEITVRWSVVLILAAIATLATVLSALVPALLASRTDPQPALQAASRGTGTRSIRAGFSAWLVASEVALSALLLVGTGLLFRTLWNLQHKQLGFTIERITLFTAMPADAAGFSGLQVSSDTAAHPLSVAVQAYQPLLQRMRNVPGIKEAVMATSPPFSGIDMRSSFQVVGGTPEVPRGSNARISAISGGYDRVLGTPLIKGRMINEDDTASAPFVMVINEAMARKFFSGRDPVGLQLNLGGKNTGMLKPYTIVGVLADQVDNSVAQPAQPLMLLPYQQIPVTSLFYQALLKTVVYFVVRTDTDLAVAPAMRSVVQQTAPGFALDNFQTMQDEIDENTFGQRIGLYLVGGFAGMAVVMVVVGLYGVLAQLVSYRRREIGVRLALGARRRHILRMVLLQGIRLTSLGLVVGIALAASLGSVVRSFLFGVRPLDAWTFVGVIVLLPSVGAIAALIPARRGELLP